jgi:hypothetical protein
MKAALGSMMLIAIIMCAVNALGATVHVVVFLPPNIPEITAVEFGVDDLPLDACSIEEHWYTEMVIGSLQEGGVALAFMPALSGPWVHLGDVTFTANEDIGYNYSMWVGESAMSDKLVVVDVNYQEHDAEGWRHIFNCTGSCWCDSEGDPPLPNVAVFGLYTDPGTWEICWQDLVVIPTGIPLEEELVLPTQWGAVKSLY